MLTISIMFGLIAISIILGTEFAIAVMLLMITPIILAMLALVALIRLVRGIL